MFQKTRQKKIGEIKNSLRRNIVLLEKTEKLSGQIAWLRFYVFLSGLVIFFTLYFMSQKNTAVVTLLLFTVIFMIVSNKQSRLLYLVKKYKKWIEIKKAHLARIELDWNALPGEKTFPLSETYALETDLDITGEKSLHRLIDLSHSVEGSRLLKEFLASHKLNEDEIMSRQKTIKELISLSHFREKFILENSLSSNTELNSGRLIDWIAKSNKSAQLKIRLIVLSVLCIINLTFILLSAFDVLSSIWAFTVFAYFSVYLLNQKYVKDLAGESELLDAELKKVIHILDFVENYNFGKNEKLNDLCSAIKQEKVSPVKQMKKINGILTLLKFRNNPAVYMTVVLLFPIDYFLAYRLEIFKAEIAKGLPAWLEIKNKLEVYVSLAVFAVLNPDYSFPEITGEGDSQELKFKAEKLGHPLIQPRNKVCNDFETNGIGSIAIITGSNMSGKSTYLRTVGANICLAYAGAPVNAADFQMSMVRLFTCIKVSDSVTDGISYFYAEVKRLKKLVDEIDERNSFPIMYLIDEIFKGTNNIERLQGSRALVRLLAGKHGAGLISTHDLELVKLADEIPSISNFHFREEIQEGKMNFDYQLRPGPCPTTNALKIMSANGLPVE